MSFDVMNRRRFSLLATGGALSTLCSPALARSQQVVLRIGDPETQRALELSGMIDALPITVEWANIMGGPKTLEAFRANALDVGAMTDIPPIHATWTGLPVKIVATKRRADPLAHPVFKLGIAPGTTVRSIGDLRGKSIAFSPSQAQGVLVLRVLKAAGLSTSDVTLIELPSTGDSYALALAGRQVDVAPIWGVMGMHYLANYAQDGATAINHGLRDDASHLVVPRPFLDDTAAVAALNTYLQFWGRAVRWVDEHPQEWIAGYYMERQGLNADEAQFLINSNGKAEIPADWSDVIDNQQKTIDLLAEALGQPHLVAADLYDRQFEPFPVQS